MVDVLTMVDVDFVVYQEVGLVLVSLDGARLLHLLISLPE